YSFEQIVCELADRLDPAACCTIHCRRTFKVELAGVYTKGIRGENTRGIITGDKKIEDKIDKNLERRERDSL
ncbi:hypothetical protein ACJX0J_030341, partial [Zea mays]